MSGIYDDLLGSFQTPCESGVKKLKNVKKTYQKNISTNQPQSGQSTGQPGGQPGGQRGQQTEYFNFYKSAIKNNNLNYLTKNQKEFFKYLLGKEGNILSCSKISKETGIAYGSIRHIINSFVNNAIISKPISCKRGKVQGLIFKFSKKIIIPGQSTEKQSALIKKERKNFFNNLSFPNFWIKQGLIEQKINVWVKEFNFTDKEWKTQLMFGAHEPKVKNADNPINYFYKSLKQGGLTRPEGFEFPEERQARIKQKEHEVRKKRIEKEKKMRQQEKELAEEESFFSLLKDKDTIEEAVKEFKQGHLTPKLKISIKTFKDSRQVDEKLENRLKMWFRE
ncbi:MAG: hypothetical protein KAI81_02940 [Candidatus Marinimicrobia bacterium]|nr:hypothetical protein [Candidatus Neomarinimicrobiota bacterium]